MKRKQGTWTNPSAFVLVHKILHLRLQKLSWENRKKCHSLVQREGSNMKKKKLFVQHYLSMIIQIFYWRLIYSVSRITSLQSYDSNCLSQSSQFPSHTLFCTDVTTWNHTRSSLFTTLLPITTATNEMIILYFPPLRHPSVKLKMLQNQPTLWMHTGWGKPKEQRVWT